MISPFEQQWDATSSAVWAVMPHLLWVSLQPRLYWTDPRFHSWLRSGRSQSVVWVPLDTAEMFCCSCQHTPTPAICRQATSDSLALLFSFLFFSPLLPPSEVSMQKNLENPQIFFSEEWEYLTWNFKCFSLKQWKLPSPETDWCQFYNSTYKWWQACISSVVIFTRYDKTSNIFPCVWGHSGRL